jgi:hypothetical protein
MTCLKLLFSGKATSQAADIPMSTTGTSATVILDKKPGISSSLKIFVLPIPAGIEGFTFFTNGSLGQVKAMKDPTGIAIIKPYNNVKPMLAPNASTTAAGPGCGGRKLCVVDNPIDVGRATQSKFNFV